MGDLFRSGDNAYGYAALKSLPLSDENSGPTEGSGSAAATGGAPVASVDGADKELAHALMGQCTAMLNGEAAPYCNHNRAYRSVVNRVTTFMMSTKTTVTFPCMPDIGCDTSLQEDEAELEQMQEPGLRKMAALMYRIERKKLLRVTRGILALYTEG